MNNLHEHSAQTIKAGSKSFAIASLLFGREMRHDAQMLYAWCRYADDVIDGQEMGYAQQEYDGTPEERLKALRRDTQAAIRGDAMDDPAFAALGEVVRRHAIPPRYPMELLDGFYMDVTQHRYQHFSETLEYCYYVAGVVGIMMALIMGVKPEEELVLHRACDLGMAFQLTNIARDVIEDAENGRIYLPADWLQEVGLPQQPEALLQPEYRAKLHGLALRLVHHAEPYYASAALGMRALPPRAAMAIGAARSVYRRIGTRLEQQRPAEWNGRIVIPKHEKQALAITAGLQGLVLSLLPPTNASRQGLWTRPA